MNISDNVKQFIDFNIEKKLISDTPPLKKYNKIVKFFYTRFEKIHNRLKMIDDSMLFQKNVYEKHSKNDNLNTDLFESHFISPSIKKQIIEFSHYIEIKTKIKNVTVSIYFILDKNQTLNNLNVFNDYTRDIIMWLIFALNETQMKMKTLTFFIAFTDEKKKLPDNQFVNLSGDHCNSGVSYSCAENGEIFIFRTEEWFKVLIHETIHALCLDFARMSYHSLRENIQSLYQIRSDFEVNEAYTEFWGEWIMCFLYSFKISPKNYTEFTVYFDFILQAQRNFSVYQSVKILNHMNLTYEDIIKNNGKIQLGYKEETHVFSYYILKMVLFFFYDEFIAWCVKNNNKKIIDGTMKKKKKTGNKTKKHHKINFLKSNENIDKLFYFIKEKYSDKDLLSIIKTFEKHFLSKKFSEIKKTLKMTIFD